MALVAIDEALAQIKQRAVARRPKIQIEHKAETCKLLISNQGSLVKVEVNMIARGLLGAVSRPQPCPAAPEEFETFCVRDPIIFSALVVLS